MTITQDSINKLKDSPDPIVLDLMNKINSMFVNSASQDSLELKDSGLLWASSPEAVGDAIERLGGELYRTIYCCCRDAYNTGHMHGSGSSPKQTMTDSKVHTVARAVADRITSEAHVHIAQVMSEAGFMDAIANADLIQSVQQQAADARGGVASKLPDDPKQWTSEMFRGLLRDTFGVSKKMLASLTEGVTAAPLVRWAQSVIQARADQRESDAKVIAKAAAGDFSNLVKMAVSADGELLAERRMGDDNPSEADQSGTPALCASESDAITGLGTKDYGGVTMKTKVSRNDEGLLVGESAIDIDSGMDPAKMADALAKAMTDLNREITQALRSGQQKN